MKLRRLVVMSTLAAALAVGATACGGGGDDQTASAAAGGTLVQLKDSKFKPASLTVRAGQTVTWDWKDRFVQHNVVGSGFASKTQRRGTFTHTFPTPGTYPYRCTLHENMKGTITVTG
ncbi:MAG TPA: cupredoxin domain-containing protein [Actinomycetota bacterium]|jgi:plastocyanin|nr:cupredoxin domain-containing protein [Actinomycetota bacterium]